MKIPDERIKVIQAASDKAPGMGLPYIDELLAERREREAHVGRLETSLRSYIDGHQRALIRAESTEKVVEAGTRVHARQTSGYWWADNSNLHLGINATLILDSKEAAE